MTANHRPLIAIVGAGLAGGLLAEELGKWARVTVFERGGSEPTRPDHPIIERHPLGLYPSYGYGLGGTTNIWHGGLLAMRPEEYGGIGPTRFPRTSNNTSQTWFEGSMVKSGCGPGTREALPMSTRHPFSI